MIVGPLYDAARKVVTGEKLVRYLSAELRDRIRTSGVVIQVIDRLIHKQLLVRPQEFVGERIACDETVATPYVVEIIYREDANYGWVPASWTSTLLNKIKRARSL